MNLGKNHRLLIFLIFAGFTLLSLFIAVIPAATLQHQNAALPGSTPLSAAELRGLKVYVREGCVACHTQQVRNIEMDHVWGNRPSIPADYYYSKQRLDVWRQSPSLLGSERTGPDLTSIGERNPSTTWHLMHLYNPRIVVPESVMPSYPWLFEEKSAAGPDDAVLNLPPSLTPPGKVVVSSQDANDLVAYLLSLKQVRLPSVESDFMNSGEDRSKALSSPEPNAGTEGALPDGSALYQSTCAVCHQPGGDGLPGAFPSLKESKIVTAEDPEIMIRIILEGYDARSEFATMPAFGDRLTDEQITAIINFERSHWGNEASQVDVETVRKIRSLQSKPVQ